MTLTFEQYLAIFPATKASSEADFLAFRDACVRFSIDSPARLAMFCAQIAHESAGRTRFVESLSYTASRLMQVWPRKFKTRAMAVEYQRKGAQAIANRAYAWILGNGDEASGDGWKFRGRGDTMLTGKDNYRRATVATGFPLDTNQDLAADPKVSPFVAAWFWSTIGGNALADRNDLMECTRRINGGTIGFAHRNELWQRFRVVFGLPAIPEEVAA